MLKSNEQSHANDSTKALAYRLWQVLFSLLAFALRHEEEGSGGGRFQEVQEEMKFPPARNRF